MQISHKVTGVCAPDSKKVIYLSFVSSSNPIPASRMAFLRASRSVFRRFFSAFVAYFFFFFRFFSANLTVYVSSHVFNARSREVIKLLCQKFRPTFFPRPSLKVNAVLKTNSYALRILCYNFYCVTQYNYFGLTKLSPSHSLSTSRSLSSARARATPLVFSTFLLHIRRTRRVSESFRERTLSNR